MKQINGFITELSSNELIIVGTNDNGHHYGGAAKQAHEQFGALWGESRGVIGGQSYGISTLDRDMKKVSIDDLKSQIKQLYRVANNNIDKKFYLTPIGTGIAGFSYDEIKPLFENLPGNIIKVGWTE